MIYLIGVLLVLGAFMMFLTGLGIYRMPDIFTRMHSATKAASLGVAILLIAAALDFRDTGVTAKAVVTILFVFLTAPVAGHVLGRAAYARRTPLWEHSVVDEARGKIAARGGEVPDETANR
jgi:multicomponent Na+:H+ antiporter subunit G